MTRKNAERGSALLVTSMVLAVLTLLGISFLIMAETENRIALSERDSLELLTVCRSGIQGVTNWFNEPDTALNPFVPRAAHMNRTLRQGDVNVDGVVDVDAPNNGTADYYMGGNVSGAPRLFDRQYRGYPWCTLAGTETNPDILIRDDPTNPNEYIDQINAMWNPTGRRSLGTVRIEEIRIYGPPTDVDLHQRYGMARVSVTAVKDARFGGRVVARRTLVAILHEIPFPGPRGAIESAGNIDESGSLGVHWGGTFAEGDTDPTSGSNFPATSVPRRTSSSRGYANFAPNAPDLDAATPGTQNLLTQLMAWAGIPDPWHLYQSNGSLIGAPSSADQPWPYSYGAGLTNDHSYLFQNQRYVFPSMDYESWKAVARAGIQNAHYFTYAGITGSNEPVFREDSRGPAYIAAHWANTENGFKPGIYFFDTKNSQNPQNGGGGVLTEQVQWNSTSVDSPTGDIKMAGFIYLNTIRLSSNGISSSGVDTVVNMPGEPFLDEGIDLNRSGTIGDTTDELATVGNEVWDFDIDNDGVSDGLRYAEVYGTAAWTTWETSHRFGAGVLPHGGADPRTLADKPHEAFLNLAYPALGFHEAILPVNYTATARPTGTDYDGNGVADTTTDLFDPIGGRVTIPNLNLDGVLYVEGDYDGSGNIIVHGSMLFKTGFSATGNPDVHFDERLIRHDWPPSEWNLPRVYASQIDSEQ